jgi:hypothetical protein
MTDPDLSPSFTASARGVEDDSFLTEVTISAGGYRASCIAPFDGNWRHTTWALARRSDGECVRKFRGGTARATVTLMAEILDKHWQESVEAVRNGGGGCWGLTTSSEEMNESQLLHMCLLLALSWSDVTNLRIRLRKEQQ